MKKKVLIFIDSFQCGGAEKSLVTLLKHFNLDSYMIELLMLKKGGDFEKFLPPAIKVNYVNMNLSVFSRVHYKILRLTNYRSINNAQLLWMCISNKVAPHKGSYDVAIGWGQGFATYYVAEKVRANKKLAWINTDYEKAGFVWKYDKSIYNKISTIVAVSDYVNTLIKPLAGQNKVITIPNIVDKVDVLNLAASGLAEELETNIFNIVTVARLEKPKNLKLAIEATRILKNKGCIFHWYLIGEGSERDSLEKEIVDSKLEAYMTLLGYRENPYPYIKKSDLYVQTSEFEGLGRTLIEASILNKPIVTTNFPSAYGIVIDKVTGFIVNMTGKEIAMAIYILQKDKGKMEGFIANSKNKITNNPNDIVKLIEKILDE